MKNLKISLLAIGLLFVSSSAFPQVQLKIGHVNIEEIMMALPARDSAQAILDKETKELQDAYEELSVTYNQLVDEYQKGLASYSALVKKSKEDELLDKQKRMSEFEQNASVTLQKRNAELVKPIMDRINQAIDKIATGNGFTYILDISKGSVVFTAKESQNITPMVLKLLKP